MGKALRYDDVKWNISGLFVHDAAILFFYDLMKNSGETIKLSVHGNIPCRFNSGRIIKSVSDEYIEWVLEEYSKRGIQVILTCSNYMLSREHLDDELSNQIIDRVAKYKAFGIISGSDLLSEYIKEKYPKVFLESSILRVVNENGKGNLYYYEELMNKYDRVVLHPDDGFNYELLEKITDMDKIEIIVNENCIRNCPNRKEHCDIVSGYYLSGRDSEYLSELEDFKRNKCLSMQNIEVLSHMISKNYVNCNMNYEELNNCYELGCRDFKLQGRSGSVATFMFDVIRYILTDETMSGVYKTLMDRIDSFSYLENEEVMNINFHDWEKI